MKLIAIVILVLVILGSLGSLLTQLDKIEELLNRPQIINVADCSCKCTGKARRSK